MPGIVKLSDIRSESLSTLPLNEHSSELVSKLVSLDPCANAAVRPSAEMFLCAIDVG